MAIRRLRLVAVATAALALLLAIVVGHRGAQAASPCPPGMTLNSGACTASFGITDAPQTFVVPAGVKALEIVAGGAPGGSNAKAAPGVPLGGLGGNESGTVSVNPGETLTLIVGDFGEDAIGDPSEGVATGGYGGGGNGSYGGGGGGGGTFVYGASSQLLLAAGGGGGQGDATNGDSPGAGGDGGGAGAGQAGGNSSSQISPDYDATGGGGPGGAGGTGATSCPPPGGGGPTLYPTGIPATGGGGESGPSSPGLGGNAELPSGSNSCLWSAGGGGGGGYAGGGGGGDGVYSGGGGGGGSGYASASVSGAQAGTSGAPGVTISIPQPGQDPQAENIEVTQGIQYQDSWDTPELSQSIPGVSTPVTSASYTGTTLVAGQETIVRLYASNRFAGTVDGVDAKLLGFDADGKPLPDSPLSPLGGARNLRQEPSLPAARTDPNGAYEFELPSSWTTGRVKLVGDVDPQHKFPDCDGCRANDYFALTDLDFKAVHPLVIRPIAIVGPGVSAVSNADVRKLFDSFAYQLPLGDHPLEVLPIAGEIDFTRLFRHVQLQLFARVLRVPLKIQDCATIGSDRLNVTNLDMRSICWDDVAAIPDAMFSIVNSYVKADPAPGEITVALWNAADFPPELERRAFLGESCGIPGNCLYAESNPDTVLHELGHDFGLFHNGCAAKTEVPWPPDESGLMDGIGLDPRSGPPFPILLPDQWYDPMTYCNQGYGHRHLSPWNWNAIAARLESSSFPPSENVIDPIPGSPRGTAPAADAAAGGHELLVTATSLDGSLSLDVSSATGPVTAADPGSPFSIILRNSSGKVISSTPVALEPGHGDGASAPIPMSLIQAVIPDRGGATVQIGDHSVVAEQLRAQPVHLAARFPRHVRGRRLTIQFRLSGAGAADATLALYYAPDGSHYQLIDYDFSGPQVTVPVSLLRRVTKHARLRLVADTGLEQAALTSRAF